MIDNLFLIVVISLLAESVWETLKMTWQNGKVSIDRVGSLIVSILICVGTDVDILKVLDIKENMPYLGVIMTAILISRGSNFMHDLLFKIEGEKIKNKK